MRAPAALSAAPPLVAPREGPLLVLGAGSIGSRHARNLLLLGQEVVLVRSGTGSGPAGLPDVAVESDLDAALARRPRAALVCTPTALHLPAALAAARAGCPVFVEKPLAHAWEGVDDLLLEARRRSLPALVGYQFRFHPGLLQVKSWLDQGAIGEPCTARAQWGEYLPDWHPGEDYRTGYSARRALGGGAILTLSHPLDYLRFLFGEVAEVSAQAARRSGLEVDVEDVAHLLLRFEAGVLAALSLDYVARPARHRLEIAGREGSLAWDGITGVARLIRGREQIRVAPPRGFGRNAMFIDEICHFLDCLEGRAVPRCSLEDGAGTLRLALAALRSVAEGRSVVPR